MLICLSPSSTDCQGAMQLMLWETGFKQSHQHYNSGLHI